MAPWGEARHGRPYEPSQRQEETQEEGYTSAFEHIARLPLIAPAEFQLPCRLPPRRASHGAARTGPRCRASAGCPRVFTTSREALYSCMQVMSYGRPYGMQRVQARPSYAVRPVKRRENFARVEARGTGSSTNSSVVFLFCSFNRSVPTHRPAKCHYVPPIRCCGAEGMRGAQRRGDISKYGTRQNATRRFAALLQNCEGMRSVLPKHSASSQPNRVALRPPSVDSLPATAVTALCTFARLRSSTKPATHGSVRSEDNAISEARQRVAESLRW